MVENILLLLVSIRGILLTAESKILSVFEKIEVGRIRAEFQVEPFLEVCEGEYLGINKATYLSSIEKPPSFSNLER